jgi:hypothetical protein
MDRFELALKTKVKAVNDCHRIANELYPKLLEIFEPLVGCKILKVDGSLLAKLHDLTKGFDDPDAHMIMHSRNSYNLQWTVKTCVNDGNGGCMYHEVGVYIANLEGTAIKDIIKQDVRRDDWTVEEITEKREAYETANKAAQEARSACEPFGTGTIH